jgi:hypothetical protein
MQTNATARLNQFLLSNNLRIITNPCISPDFCLDWTALRAKISDSDSLKVWDCSRFQTDAGTWTLIEDPETGDCAWHLRALKAEPNLSACLQDGFSTNEQNAFFPASWANLLRIKNLVQEHDGASTIFPSTGGNLGRGTLGIGARFTTLHWPAVEWSMAALNIGLTANQNSIPRELVYDVEAMLDGRLDSVPFPFIGANVPEGHQGQSVEGMSHGCVLSKLKYGFHQRKIAWSFNADHQPIGGKFDVREDALVRGCLLASYITFDLSPELAAGTRARLQDIDAALVNQVRARVASVGIKLDETAFNALLEQVWPSMAKMKRRDEKYAAARNSAFTTPAGRAYLRELSIDELPGLTTPETTAVMLALCEALGMKIHFVAPAFGFQKNMPCPDNAALRVLIEKQWAVCRAFDASIGFHSGSGKSAENYQVMGSVTGSRLEIKTSGRYTYEMGRALFASKNPYDQALWNDWYKFTVELALASAFAKDPIECKMARSFIVDALVKTKSTADESIVFATAQSARTAIERLTPSPEHMFWFEYNFLYVLAADGRAEKSKLGDHSAAGYRQRARFYTISEEGRLGFFKNVAHYILFLAENTGLAPTERIASARTQLNSATSLNHLLSTIAT